MSETIARQLKIEEFPFEIKDKLGNVIYMEYEDGEWFKRKFNDQNCRIYYERSDGYWIKQEYDEEGFEIYYENSHGYKKGDFLKAERHDL